MRHVPSARAPPFGRHPAPTYPRSTEGVGSRKLQSTATRWKSRIGHHERTVVHNKPAPRETRRCEAASARLALVEQHSARTVSPPLGPSCCFKKRGGKEDQGEQESVPTYGFKEAEKEKEAQ